MKAFHTYLLFFHEGSCSEFWLWPAGNIDKNSDWTCRIKRARGHRPEYRWETEEKLALFTRLFFQNPNLITESGGLGHFVTSILIASSLLQKIANVCRCFASVYVCARSTCSACGGQKRASDPLELVYRWFWAILWVLGSEPRSTAGTVSALTYWAISPDPKPPMWLCSSSWPQIHKSTSARVLSWQCSPSPPILLPPSQKGLSWPW